MEIWLKTESLSMSQLTVDGFLSTVSRGHLNSFSAMDFYSPQPQELQLLLSLARLAVQARPDSLFLFIFVLRHVLRRYCTYFYGWQILQVILLPHSSDFKHLICYPCSPCSTFIHICCTFSREGHCLTGHASFAQSDLQMCHGQNMLSIRFP